MRWPGAGLVLLVSSLIGCASSGKLPTAPALADKVVEKAAPTPAPERTPQAVTVHRVAKGESLWRIARQALGSGTRYSEIASLNQVAGPDYWLQPGQELKLPGSGALTVPAQKAKPRTRVDEATKYGWTKKDRRAFSLGERLVFSVKYFNVTAGYATLHISEAAEVQGRPTWHIVAEAKTHPFFETFFKVRDRTESYVDAEYLIPWAYEKHLREGAFSADAVYVYDQRAHYMREPTKGKDVPIPPETQDPLSVFYRCRLLDLTVGSSHIIKVAADDMKNYELKVDVLRKERVSVPAGDFDTVLVQPHLKFQGVFKHKGDFFVWISDDERKLPVKVQSKVSIGAIHIELQEAEWVRPQ